MRRGDALGETEKAIARQLEDLILELPADIAVAALLRCLAAELDLDQLTTVTRVLTRTTESQLRSELNKELRAELCGYLKDGVTAVLSEDDYRGELKADLATALARIGSPDDLTELNRLLRADIERVKRGRADSIRRRISPLAQGAGICWARWHVRALISLDASYAEEVLLDLLNEPDDERYAYEAASALVELARIGKVPEQFGHKIDFSDIWIARSGEAPMRFDEERRQRYARVIKERLCALLAEQTNNTELAPRTRRLKELGHALAVLDAKESAGLVMEVLALPEEWDAWTRLRTMEALLFGGAALPAESTIGILNHAVDQIRAQGVSDHNVAWEFTRCLCILVFVDSPALGIERTRQMLAETPLWPSALQNLFRALGASRAGGDALSLLLELRPPAGVDQAGSGEEWINAVALIGTAEAKRELMASIEQRDYGTEVQSSDPDSSEAETLAARIADLVRDDGPIKNRVYELCALQALPAKRQLLAKIIARVGTTEAILAGLNLIDDEAAPPVLYDIQRALEDVFLERRPYLNTGSHTLAGRSANEVRAKLFEMSISDARRKRSAFALLGQIEVWRLEHGRPSEEPRHPAFESGLEWPSDFTE